ncbi:tRNA-aminoacylation cofactor ARC1 [Candida viswanathii]|uniref:tRNA-aminoacylation cofactor ARC1 n=1 Tax=Candida viswanathii TaxID=5486 RepID=A0A367Y219_9ASCO|nr:tRNA-aminoacylation cofactor ARC1 [Candida viswanathii]
MLRVFTRGVKTFTPSYLKLQVGQIQSCKKHDASDKLYVSQVDIGHESQLQICSGLVPFLPIEEMYNRRVVVVTNMKTRKLRGEASMGMILAAEKEINDKLKVEPITPPKSSILGERLYFGGADSFEPPKLKDKSWEYIQPRLTTNSDRQVVFVDDQLGELVLRGTDETDSATAETLVNAKIL